jgi:hypothetical protein
MFVKMRQSHIVNSAFLCFLSFLQMRGLTFMCDAVCFQMKRKFSRVKEIDPDLQLRDAAKLAVEKLNKFKDIFILQQVC